MVDMYGVSVEVFGELGVYRVGGLGVRRVAWWIDGYLDRIVESG